MGVIIESMSVPPIALDVMGGDRGTAELVAGGVAAVRQDGASIAMVGRRTEIEAALAAVKATDLSIEIVDAPDVIEMSDNPVATVRARPQSSIVVGVAGVRAGQAAGFVSTGNSGAVMAAAVLGLGRVRGVDRPALASAFPTLHGYCLLCDIGANLDCRPENLLQFGVMASTYWERVFGVTNPRVGLLSNGEEDSKGNTLVRETHALLRQSSVNFVGNVEGKDIPHHSADVILMDGFTGNVLLKTAEGTATLVREVIRQEARRSLLGSIGGLLMKGAFRRISRRLDYQEYGGAPLLGVNGICIIAHGRSDARAVRSAIRVARHAAESGLTEAVRSAVQSRVGVALGG